MSQNGRILALTLILAIASSAGRGSTAPSAEAIIAASKRASGGSAWDRLEGCHEVGTRGNGAMTYTTWFDMRHYGLRVESRRAGTIQSIGFNGKASWRTNAAGKTESRVDGESLREAVLTAYLSSNGFFFPKRFPASFRYLRETHDGSKTFDAIEIVPSGGRAFEAWFDRETHLIGRVVDRKSGSTVTVMADDYRRIGKLMIAFGLTIVAADGTLLERGKLTSITCGPIDKRLFDPPVPASQ